MIIWLSGPTGAGKTSLARSLRESGWSIVEEYAPQDLFRAFASQPATNCEALQRCLMQARLDGWRRVSDSPCVAFDRSIDEDIEVFCKMHMRAGLLTQMQFGQLAQLGEHLQLQMPKPDLIVYVSAEPAVLFSRIQSAEAPEPIIQSFSDQMSAYAEWLQSRTEQVLRLDTTRSSEKIMARFFTGIRC